MTRFGKLAVAAGVVGLVWLVARAPRCPECGSPFGWRVGEALPSRDGARFRECLWCGKCWKVEVKP